MTLTAHMHRHPPPPKTQPHADGALLCKRELGPGPELFSQLAVDPLDSRQLCLCGSNGALAVLQLNDPGTAAGGGGDRGVALKQYRVNLKSTGVFVWVCLRVVGV